jgi:hypothetical protein
MSSFSYSNFNINRGLHLSYSRFFLIQGPGSNYICIYELKYSSGEVYYRTATSSDKSSINSYISQAYSSSYSASNAFIVTYYNLVDAYGRSNTFQAVLTTDGTHSYVIFNFGTCASVNARSFVQNATNTYIMWDNTVGSYTSYSAYMYDYFTYGIQYFQFYKRFSLQICAPRIFIISWRSSLFFIGRNILNFVAK